ncbi:hypothetical protein HKBW3S47_02429, partial [Candidatus Hakubella thermalkaliphila]
VRGKERLPLAHEAGRIDLFKREKQVAYI